MKIVLYILTSVLFLFGCGIQNSKLTHIDDVDSRGGSQPQPWHIHTGQGFSSVEYDDNGVKKIIKSQCKLSQTNPICEEKIYFFTKSEIMHFVNKAKELYLTRQQSHTSDAVLSGSISVTTGKAALTDLAAGTKVGGILLGVVSGISGLVASWQGLKAYQIMQKVEDIDNWLTEEESYVVKCNHLRKNFFLRAREFGITILLNKHGGQYVDSSYYFSSLAQEQNLYLKTLEYATQNNLPRHKAYEDYFLNQCGHLPMTDTTTIDDLFSTMWTEIPQSVVELTLTASKALSLNSKAPLEFSKFKLSLLDEESEYQSILAFFSQLQQDIKYLEDNPQNPAYNQLALFRKQIDYILIQPKYNASIPMRKTNNKSYTLIEQDGKTYLILFAKWGWLQKGYEISIREFWCQQMNICLN